MSEATKLLLAAVAATALWAAGATAQEATESQGEEPAAETAEDAPAGGDEPAEAEPPAETGDEAAPGPSDLSMGEPVEDQVGTTYVAEVHGDWQMRCVRTGEERDPCQLYQLLQDEEGNSVAEISLAPLPEGQEAAAGATVITPLETLLTAQLRLAVDGGQVRRYPFTWCSAVGCFSRIGFTEAEVEQFKAGRTATITIVPVAAPDQTVELTVSLSGFTAGFEAVEANNSAG